MFLSLATVSQDVRYGPRMMGKNPGFIGATARMKQAQMKVS
jgi:hypothetical protein